MNISYYDLLGLVQKGKEPKEVELKITNYKAVKYIAEYDDVDNSFCYYYIKSRLEKDYTYQYFLSDCLEESEMFDKNILITKEK